MYFWGRVDEDFQPPAVSKKTFSDHLLQKKSLLLEELQSVHQELVDSASDNMSECAELARMLKCRMDLRGLCASMDAYVCHLLASTRRAKQQDMPVDEDEVRNLKSTLDASAASAAASLEHLLSIPSTIPNMLSQHSLPGAENVQFAFSTSLVKMMQNSPIRHIKFNVFPAAVGYIRGVCSELLEIGELIKEFDMLDDAGKLSLDHLLQSIAACSQLRLHIVTRSVLVSALHKISINMEECIFQSMRCHGVPMALLQWEPLALFVREVMVQVCWSTVKGLTVNRSKLLIKLDGLLASWGTVMTDVHEISLQFLVVNKINDEKQIWCQYWTMLHTTLLMDMFMAVSAESNLLSANELDYFFWYWDFVCNTRVYAFEKLRTLKHAMDTHLYNISMEEYAANMMNLEVLAVANKEKKHGGHVLSSSVSPPHQPPKKPDDPFSSIDEILQRARGHLCKGIFRLLVVANQWGLVVRKDNKYTSWQWRFMQRFRAFQNILNPPMLTFDEFIRVLFIGKEKHSSAHAYSGGNYVTRAETAAGGEDIASEGCLHIDLPVSQRILQDAIMCFSNAKKLLADVKKINLGFLGEKYLLDLAGPLLKVASVALFICLLETNFFLV